MKVRYLNKHDKAPENSITCVIDVIRAFSVTAYAFANQAKEIILSPSKDFSFQLKEKNPEYILIGESSGIKIEGFDYGNSPVEISEVDIKNKTLVQKTSNGTEGAVNNLHVKKLIAGSFVNANAVYNYIKDYVEKTGIEDICFVITNNYRSSEDAAFADYISERLFGNSNCPVEPYLEVVRNCRYSTMKKAITKKDVQYVTDVDKFDFIMEIAERDGMAVMNKV